MEENNVEKYIVANVLRKILYIKFIRMMEWIPLTIGYVFLVTECVTVENVKFIMMSHHKLFKQSICHQNLFMKIIKIIQVAICFSLDNNLIHHFNTVHNCPITITNKKSLIKMESQKNKDP